MKEEGGYFFCEKCDKPHHSKADCQEHETLCVPLVKISVENHSGVLFRIDTSRFDWDLIFSNMHAATPRSVGVPFKEGRDVYSIITPVETADEAFNQLASYVHICMDAEKEAFDKAAGEFIEKMFINGGSE